jgi:hypothetical protein
MTSKPALGATRPPVQRVPGAVSPAVKRQKREAATHLHLVLRLRMVELYLHSHIHLHGILACLLKLRNNFTFLRFTLRVVTCVSMKKGRTKRVTCIMEVLGSNLGHKIDKFGIGFFMILLSP